MKKTVLGKFTSNPNPKPNHEPKPNPNWVGAILLGSRCPDTEENISQKFRLENRDKTRNYFFEETEQNELMSRNHKKVCTTLNDIKDVLSLAPILLDVFRFLLLLLWLVFL